MRTIRRFSLVALTFPLFAACGNNGVIAFQRGNDIHWATLENVPPGDVVSTSPVTSLTGGWELEHLSLSPSGVMLAVGLRKHNNPSAGVLDTKVIVFNLLQAPPTRLSEWDEGDMKALIENNSNVDYPDALVDFVPTNLSWMTADELLINVQPVVGGAGIELVPQDVALVVHVRTGNVTDGPDLYPRGNPSPITAPAHPEKTAFTTENRSGTIFIDGGQVTGLLGGIGMFDFVYLGR